MSGNQLKKKKLKVKEMLQGGVVLCYGEQGRGGGSKEHFMMNNNSFCLP